PITDGRDLFSASHDRPSSSRVTVTAAVGVALAGVVGIALGLGSVHGLHDTPSATAPTGQNRTRETRTLPASSALPLELTQLTHERDAERLIVRGVVHNPASGSTVDRLAAVVSLFNHAGEAVASARARIDAPALAPGSDSPFSVTIPAGGNVGRYRISF